VNVISNGMVKALALASIFFLQSCANNPTKLSDNTNSVVGQLVISEPLSINYKDEIAIARWTDIIQRTEISAEQRAKIYYERGLIYDRVGLRVLARIDFEQALKLKPDMAEVYNYKGILLVAMQEYAPAYEAFDSVLDLAPEHQYVYLNRGIALYYGDKPQLALDDVKAFYQFDTSDPYRLLWLYLVEQKLDAAQALITLKNGLAEVDETVWAREIIRLYLGEITQQEFIASFTVDIRSNKALSERLCEAYFYLGKLNQMQNHDRVAINFFKLALSTNVFEFVEHRYAKLELDLFRQALTEAKPIL